jgi:hypothetical protein
MAQSQVPNSQTFATQVPKTYEAGEKQFTRQITQDKPRVLAVGTVAAAGSDQTDAADLPIAPFVAVTGANGTKGVILPPAGAGLEIKMHNVANAALKVYPHSGGDVNDGTQDAAVTVAAKTQASFTCVDGVTWSATGVS